MSFLRRHGGNAASTVAPPPAGYDGLEAKRGSEPLRDYDALDATQIAAALAHADVETLTRVREYELKFRRRDGVLAELTRLRQSGRPSGRA